MIIFDRGVKRRLALSGAAGGAVGGNRAGRYALVGRVDNLSGALRTGYQPVLQDRTPLLAGARDSLVIAASPRYNASRPAVLCRKSTMPEPTAFSAEPPSPNGAPPGEAPRHGGNPLLLVFLVVVLDLLGFGIVLPLLPRLGDQYLKDLFAGGKESVGGGAVLGGLMAVFSLMQFVFAPGWGRLSDRIGRRPVLLVGLAGSVVFYALLGYALTFPDSQATTALILLFIARAGAGVAGANISTAQAVIADCTPPEKRKHGMALIGAAFGIGFTLGPVIGGVALPFFPGQIWLVGAIASVLSLGALLFGLARLPETRRPGGHSAARKLIDFRVVRFALGSPAVAPVLWTFFLASLGFASFEATLALLVRDSLGLNEADTFWIF